MFSLLLVCDCICHSPPTLWRGVRMMRKQTHTHRNPPRIDCNIFLILNICTHFKRHAKCWVGFGIGNVDDDAYYDVTSERISVSPFCVLFLIVSGSDYCTPSYQKLCIRKRFAFVFYPQRLFGLSFIYFRTISRFESCVANTMEMLRVSWLTGMRLWRCKLVYGFFLSSFSSFILSFHQRMELQPHLNFMWASILMPYIHPNRRLFAHQRCPTYSLVQHGQFSEAKIPKTVALCVGESSNP